MNIHDISTLINIIAVIITTRIWGLWGAVPYAITFALLAVFWK